MAGSPNSTEFTQTRSTSLHEKIANLYYRHGLFCASNPYLVILLTLMIASFCCYPLLYQPILGSSSQHFETPFTTTATKANQDNIEETQSRTPRWFQSLPVGFVQQIVIKSSVTPWEPDLLVTDAFRAPLGEVFRVVESIANHQFYDSEHGLMSLDQICLQVGEPLEPSLKNILPMYGCLKVSPAAIWNENFNKFHQDGNILRAIFDKYSEILNASVLREILFGVPWKETGIKKFLMRTRQRVLTYAITVVYSSFNVNYTLSLQSHLMEKYPASLSLVPEKNQEDDVKSITHIYFEDNYTMAEFIPLGVTYIILFLYIYFSVRKIDLVKYKWALAVSAVFTVMMSLLMSVGLCIWFGLNPTLNGSLSFSEIFPYLVVIIGLENMLVLTKSVVSTPVHLDVKIRVAQGLSKEGWSITKNLFTELTLLAFSFFTFVPAIQEFCLFAVVGLLSDFFLQMVFFLTVLSIDIRRLEFDEYHKPSLKKNSSVNNLSENNCDGDNLENPDMNGPVLRRTRLGLPKMRAPVVPYNNTPYSTSVFAPPTTQILAKVPKRLRFFHFWARTRMVQRGLMCSLVIWLGLLVYNSGLVEHFVQNTTYSSSNFSYQVKPFLQAILNSANLTEKAQEATTSLFNGGSKNEQTLNIDNRLQHQDFNLWQSLPTQHWTTLFGFYNISLLGRYISILPPIHLSIPLSPESAIQMRHPAESDPSLHSYFKTYIDKLQDEESEETFIPSIPIFKYQPSSMGEIILGITLALPTFLLFIYFMVILYRCICPRHYAEWRASWKSKATLKGQFPSLEIDPNTYLIMETLPIRLSGHEQEVDDVVCDENILCSICLNGDIRVWDAMSGECLTVISRSHRQRSRQMKTRKNKTVSVDFNSGLGNEDQTPNIPNSRLAFTWTPSDMDHNYRSHYRWSSDSGMSSPTTVHNDQNDVTNDTISSNDTTNVSSACNEEVHYSSLTFQPVWCMASKGSWLLLGCAGGRVELWDVLSGSLLNTYNYCNVGVTAIHLEGNRLYVARMNGVVDFLLIDVCENSPDDDITAKEAGLELRDKLQIVWLHSLRAHNSPITVLKVLGGHIITGSQDHLMKVFYCDTGTLIYTFHGHSGALSALHVDQLSPSFAASGCQQGLICVWDLLTGTCVYSLQANQGSIVSLITTPAYLISSGINNSFCIWEKNQGHLLHTIRQHNLCNDLALLTSGIVVSANQNRLVLWDVNYGDALRVVILSTDDHVVIRQLRIIGRAIVCTYGNELCVVHFPAMTEKGE